MQTDQDPREFKILLVDDRKENLIALQEILDTKNRIFLIATSGNEALQLVLKNEDIGLIMLDVQMPEMDGFEVARLLKANPKTKDISIIFVTAIGKEEQYVLKGFEEGAVDYLQKPLDINVTVARVNVFERLYFYQNELKHALAEKGKTNKQLEQFVYIVAHDLKSPLAGIIGLLSILQEEKIENPLVSEYMELISNAAYHLSDMITSILEYAKNSIDGQATQDVNVDEMVRQIAQLLFPPVHIQVNIQDMLPSMRTKKLKLQQVFQNLISNAIKYNDKEKGLIEIGHSDKGDFIEFYVKDNGPGISAGDHDKIFKLFHTSNNSSTGDSSTGIGLNIIKFAVEEQGGNVWVESDPGCGSCFYFTWKKHTV